MSTISLRKSPLSQAVSEISPLDLRAPLPKEVFEEVRSEVEQSPGGQTTLSTEVNEFGYASIEVEILPEIPIHWSKGALLNVRNRGDHYCITLYPEEFDPRSPERAMLFPNTWTCQDFVSKWYSRETADPRAR